jgi:hypothetical protein
MHLEFLSTGSIFIEDLDESLCLVDDAGQEADQMFPGESRVESFP